MKKKGVSKKIKEIVGAVFTLAGLIGLLFVIGLYTNFISESILYPATCSKDGVFLKFYFEDEPDIPQCMVGTIRCWSISPSGIKTSLGGYEASFSSTEKINCPPYSGKSFVGGYITNEGAGEYAIQCAGIYYEKDSTGLIIYPHEFSVSDSVRASCPTLDEFCEDGTPTGQCSSEKPMFCSKYGDLYEKSSVCGCPSGYEREIGGNSCVIPSQNVPPEEEIPEVEVPEDLQDPIDEETIPEPTGTTETADTEKPIWALDEQGQLAVGLVSAILLGAGIILLLNKKKR